MAKALSTNGTAARSAQGSKYDAHNTVLSKTYGALADLRRELSDSKASVAERDELLKSFAVCADSQRAWLLLEDYFEKLSLSRKDFPNTDWWPRLLAAQGKERLEEVAFLFMRAERSLPTELAGYTNATRFLAVEQAAQQQKVVKQLESWLFPRKPAHLDSPRSSLRVVCRPLPDGEHPSRKLLAVQFQVSRPRAGEKVKGLAEVIELTARAAHEQEQFPPGDWEFIQWLAEAREQRIESREQKSEGDGMLVLSELEWLQWLARWGNSARMELA